MIRKISISKKQWLRIGQEAGFTDARYPSRLYSVEGIAETGGDNLLYGRGLNAEQALRHAEQLLVTSGWHTVTIEAMSEKARENFLKERAASPVFNPKTMLNLVRQDEFLKSEYKKAIVKSAPTPAVTEERILWMLFDKYVLKDPVMAYKYANLGLSL